MIYCLMGKSASGKDTVYRRLLAEPDCGLEKIVPYTTRPIRAGETDGEEYHFTDIAGMEKLKSEGRVIESRVYHTVHGDWYYFTVDDGFDAGKKDYLLIGTLEVYNKIREYYGADQVCPLLLTIDDGERLSRALTRERQQETPRYAELCRRFLADEQDFSGEKIGAAGITELFDNTDLEDCIREIRGKIDKQKAGRIQDTDPGV